jgi:chromosome segregation ATPase
MNSRKALSSPWRFGLAALFAASVGLSGAALAQSSTTPAKPPAKPADKPAAKPAATKPAAAAAAPAAGRQLSLGGEASAAPSGTSRLLTRDELRACLNQRDALTKRLNELDAARAALDTERVAIQQERAAVTAEREAMVGMRDAVAALNAKTEAFKRDVDAWNADVKQFNESRPTSPAVAQQRQKDLNERGTALQARQASLETERKDLLARGDEAVKAFNAKVEAAERKVADWNERNKKLNADVDATQQERKTWVTECGERRYREDDEKAILSGR